jgi:hypothetical protein
MRNKLITLYWTEQLKKHGQHKQASAWRHVWSWGQFLRVDPQRWSAPILGRSCPLRGEHSFIFRRAGGANRVHLVNLFDGKHLCCRKFRIRKKSEAFFFTARNRCEKNCNWGHNFNAIIVTRQHCITMSSVGNLYIFWPLTYLQSLRWIIKYNNPLLVIHRSDTKRSVWGNIWDLFKPGLPDGLFSNQKFQFGLNFGGP